jgi:GntR family transcriptional regulator, rspAB operon transcriptional repressor
MKKLVIKKDDTIRKKVYDHLRKEILSGAIVPNERLIEAKIAKQIGTSRTPVREALHNLELEKLITSLPNSGYVVNPLSKEEVEQLCEIRASIECLAARWAAQKENEKLVDELSKNIAAAENEVKKGKITSFIELDAQFHEIIARLCGSERLFELAQTLRYHMLRYRIQSILTKDSILRAIEGHRLILKAIIKGDTGKIDKSINFHLDQVKKDIIHYAFEMYNKNKDQ